MYRVMSICKQLLLSCWLNKKPDLIWLLVLLLVSGGSSDPFDNDLNITTYFTTDGGSGAWNGYINLFSCYEIPRPDLCDGLRYSDLDVYHTGSLSTDTSSWALSQFVRTQSYGFNRWNFQKCFSRSQFHRTQTHSNQFNYNFCDFLLRLDSI